MKAMLLWLALCVTTLTSPPLICSQERQQVPRPSDEEVAEKAFKAANELMDQRKYAEALAHYQEALALFPDTPALLFNGALAAYLKKDFALAARLWGRLVELEPNDGQAHTKLIQAYQALGDLKARDAVRQALFELHRSGKDPELARQDFYCREQFEVAGQKVMAFEHFELKGPRALRYVFSVLDKEKGETEEFRISLGSYDLTNNFAVESGQVKAGQRIFHLDGYYAWGHATFGFYTPEPSYDEVRKLVISILEGELKAVSSSAINPAARKP